MHPILPMTTHFPRERRDSAVTQFPPISSNRNSSTAFHSPRSVSPRKQTPPNEPTLPRETPVASSEASETVRRAFRPTDHLTTCPARETPMKLPPLTTETPAIFPPHPMRSHVSPAGKCKVTMKMRNETPRFQNRHYFDHRTQDRKSSDFADSSNGWRRRVCR